MEASHNQPPALDKRFNRFGLLPYVKLLHGVKTPDAFEGPSF
jgi:hypothetical protein